MDVLNSKQEIVAAPEQSLNAALSLQMIITVPMAPMAPVALMAPMALTALMADVRRPLRADDVSLVVLTGTSSIPRPTAMGWAR